MSWGTAWGNGWGGSFGDGIALSVSDSAHASPTDAISLAGIGLTVAGTDHSVSSDQATPVVASTLSISESTSGHLSDTLALSQSNPLSASEASHGHLSDAIGLFAIPELILNGFLFGGEPFPIRMSGVQCAVIPGTNLYAQAPVLQSSSVTVWDGQIAIQYSGFHFEDIGSDYLVILYKPGSPRVGGGPFPATMVDASTHA